MPDPYLTDLPARTVSPEHVHRARLRVATASLVEYPDEGDPRAGWDCARLLDMLGLSFPAEPQPGLRGDA